MIEAKGLRKSYGGKRVIDDVSFKVPTGKAFGFLGQNGSGKTTTIKMMVGIISPDSGNITIGGMSPSDREARKKMGFMPEAPYFYERLTGMEFLIFCNDLCGARKEKTEKSLEHILQETGIYEARDKTINTYSKGMKQRLGLAQALVNDPEYVFLDEPFDGLDPIGRREAKQIIKNLRAKGKTIFFNSHILYDIEELCDEIGIIHEGKIIYCGPVKEFCGGKSLEDRFVSFISSKAQSK
jgi:ABC-2 type transport system ATP-binding protein